MKNLVLILLLLVITGTIQSQKPDTSKVFKKYIEQGPVVGAFTEVNDIELFEYPKFKGRTGRLRWENGKLVAPFKTANISFRVPAGRIVYIRKCISDFPDEEAFTGAVDFANLSAICGIRSDVAVTIPIQFNGVATIIHNNDCRRVFGDIRVKVYESAPDGAAQAMMRCNAIPVFRADAFTFLALSHPNSTARSRYGRLVHDANPAVPVIPTVVNSVTGGEAVGNFVVGASGLRDGRVGIIITTSLGSAHKTCDLCDDFSSNVRMTAPVTKTYPINRAGSDGRILNAANNRIQSGPLRAQGSRDGFAITASGGIFLDFHTQFTVNGL
jgi:hypothetical protein